MSSSLYAQDIDTLNKEVTELEKQLAELRGDAVEVKERVSSEEYQEKQKRIAKNIAKATARTQKNMVKSPKSAMYQKVLALQKQRLAYLTDLSEGKIRAFPDVVEQWESYQTKVAELIVDYKAFQDAESPEKKAALATPLLAALQPVGPWLDNARHSSANGAVATEAEIEQHERLQKRYHETRSAGPEGQVKLITPSYSFALKYVPVSIQFIGPPETEILLYSEVGGTFPNDLIYTSIKTDKKGLASTSWISKGEAVANCSILYRSTGLPEKGKINITVRRLSLLPLKDISPVVGAATNNLNKLETFKK